MWRFWKAGIICLAHALQLTLQMMIRIRYNLSIILFIQVHKISNNFSYDLKTPLQTVEISFSGHQLVESTIFHQLAMMEHKNLIGIGYCVNTMGYRYTCFSFHHSIQ